MAYKIPVVITIIVLKPRLTVCPLLLGLLFVVGLEVDLLVVEGTDIVVEKDFDVFVLEDVLEVFVEFIECCIFFIY